MNVCVVIPTFNAGGLLREAVESALAVGVVTHVVVIDDGSKPPVEIGDVAGPEDANGRVMIVRQENAGPSAARNRGLNEARMLSADAVVFLDADDRLNSDIGRSIELMRSNGAVAAVSGRVDVRPDGSKRERPAPAEWAGEMLPRKSVVFKPIGLFGTPGLVVDRRVIESEVRFDESLKHGEDREFLRRVADVGPIVVSDALAVEYRVHEGGQNLNSAAHFARRTLDFAAIVAKHCDEESNPYFRESGTWLINAIAKSGGGGESWGTLVQVFRTRGWPVPIKARVRHAMRRFIRSPRSFAFPGASS